MLPRLLELIGELHGVDDLDEFRTEILIAVNRAVPNDWSSYNEVHEHPEDMRALTIPEPPPHLWEIFTHLAHQHPLIARMRGTGDGRPLRISDVVTVDEYHALDLYQQVYRLLGVESQVAFTLPAQLPTVLGIALSRGEEDFADHEVELLSHARPHLIQAYRNAELSSARAGVLASLEAGLEQTGRPLVVVDQRGRLEFATAGARALLGDGARLPAPVADWLAARVEPTSATEPLLFDTAQGRVSVRALPRASGDRRTVLLLGNGDGGLDIEGLRSLGLTGRQAETLRWIALGRSAADAARAMGIAERTVHKHLQAVYAKLGVTSRSQAAATAWDSIGA
ncbi:MAG TPA: LuxR C-terminal-related transcriptional regulator [Thermoleophilaceae bacterium]